MSLKSMTQIQWKKSIGHVTDSWLLSSTFGKKAKKGSVQVRAFLTSSSNKNDLRKQFKDLLTESEITKVQNSTSGTELFQREEGYILIQQPLKSLPKKTKDNHSVMPTSEYKAFQNSAGMLVSVIRQKSIKVCHLTLLQLKKEHIQGVLTGLELASYNFRGKLKGKDHPCELFIEKDKGQILKTELNDAAYTAVGVNLARHLVNLPSNWLAPKPYAELVKKLFLKVPGVKVEVWGEAEVVKQKMGLMAGVASGSVQPPQMVHIKYRPTAAGAPIAFVGKGVTFDTGGSDIKSSSGMRNMKKDMGGSASLVGVAYAMSKMKSKQSFDVYLGLVENCLDGAAYVPGDILQGRNGKTVEIHNTDAEGRLVVADVLDVATTKKGKDKPTSVIDVCTLTGAIKVGLGADIAGLFSNSDHLAKKIQSASEFTNEKLWRMPLFPGYMSQLKSNVADMTNCSAVGFGGAITAALFLQEFTNDIPWAHFDIYAWKDSVSGAYLDTGGNGQMVQCLVEAFKK